MNDTKWTEIFKSFYYDIECSDDPRLSKMFISWTTKSPEGYTYSDTTWSHFGVTMEQSKEIEWLKIDLTEENRETVIGILRNIHVPGEVFDNCVYVYGYRMDVDYIE